jgi:alanine dehydrogenase
MSTRPRNDARESDPRTLLFGPEEVVASIDMRGVVEAVGDAFAAHHRGEAIMPPKSYVELPRFNGDFRAMPASVGDAAGLKWVNVHPDNPSSNGLPTVMGVMIYSDPRTGFPLALLDGTTLTRFRTGAAAAVATRELAPPDARSLGLIGAGVQAHTQLRAIATVREIEEVVIHDVDEERARTCAEEESGDGRRVRVGTAEEAAGCAILSTVTPVRDPIVRRAWLRPGTHVNAIGADAEGKQELESAVVEEARVVIDDWEQCSHSGEINVPVSEGRIARGDIHGTLGAIVAGELEGRSAEEITVFDSTGLAIQDVATARLVYETGRERGRGAEFELVAT